MGGTVTGTTAPDLLAAGVDVTGRFVTRDGREAADLHLPSGTRISADCAGQEPCPPSIVAETSLQVDIAARPGLRFEVDARAGDGVEVEVAGVVWAHALDRTWDGLVGSLEANDLEATAVCSENTWTVEAKGEPPAG